MRGIARAASGAALGLIWTAGLVVVLIVASEGVRQAEGRVVPPGDTQSQSFFLSFGALAAPVAAVAGAVMKLQESAGA
jgi:hypothetical protein